MALPTQMPHKDVPPPLELVKGRIEEVLPPAAREEVQSGEAVLVDVRDPERFQAGRIEGAAHVNAGQSARLAHGGDFASKVEQAAGGRDGRVLVYCGEGNRSARAADALRNEHGFERAASLVGGVKLWSDLGYPVEGEIAAGDDDAEPVENLEGDTT